MVKSIKHRLDVWKEEPLYWDSIVTIDKRLAGSSVPRSLLELIKIRISQINKCAYCIEYHSQDALHRGETPNRIFALSAWKESPFFSDSEKAALHVAEEVTHISAHGISDEAYEKLKSYFDIKQVTDIIVCACLINFLNRIGISTKTVPA